MDLATATGECLLDRELRALLQIEVAEPYVSFFLTSPRSTLPMLSSPPPNEPPDAARLRGHIFTDLDRLAFALEMETVELLREGREAEAQTRQQLRLGVRLAQRLVAGVWADEVDLRIQEWTQAYDSRLGMVAS